VFLQEEELAKLGLDASKAHRLETAETAEALYKKREKKPAPEGWWVACLHACILACWVWVSGRVAGHTGVKVFGGLAGACVGCCGHRAHIGW
jgi:hypothetical protein